MQVVPLHLLPGSDLRRSLEEFAIAHGATGFVLGVVGDLSGATFQCPGQPQPTRIEGDLEIITLNGTLSPRGVHLHLSLSDGACQVWGGHLEHGSPVRKGADLLVGLLAAPVAAAEPQQQAADQPLPIGSVAQAIRPVPQAIRAAQPASSPVLEIAVLNGCPFSARALRMLRTLGIPHQSLQVNSAAERAVIAERSGRTSLPQVFIDGRAIGGYDALVELHSQGVLDGLRVG
jgi:predicted DNA-binding protein with PD1-like motif/glutaredoxin